MPPVSDRTPARDLFSLAALDGAAVMPAAGALLKEQVPHHLTTHAVAHVLELGSHDCLDMHSCIAETLATNQECYNEYHASAKKQLAVDHMAMETTMLTFC